MASWIAVSSVAVFGKGACVATSRGISAAADGAPIPEVLMKLLRSLAGGSGFMILISFAVINSYLIGVHRKRPAGVLRLMHCC